VSQLFVPIVPTDSAKDALVSLVKTQPLRAGPQAAMLAFWHTKSDREQAVYPGQNRYVRDAPLSAANFESWLGVVEGLLKPGDVVVICEGNDWGNKHIIMNKLASTKWTIRPVFLEFDDEGGDPCGQAERP